jgi:death-on-curing protein
VKFLSADQVIAMHARLLHRWGGEEGGGHRGAEYEGVEAAVQAVKNSYYEVAEELAAAYAVYIVQVHVFMDGNKRTGAAAMLTFLIANGGRPVLTRKAVADAMLDLQARAEAGEQTDTLVRWLSELLVGHGPST